MRRPWFVAPVILVLIALAWVGPVAAAGHRPVDPASLSPQPPGDTVCWSTGTAVRCDSIFDASRTNEPEFELPCGVVYATVTDIRTSTRWYQDGLLVRRQVHQTVQGFWTLSPTGADPQVTVVTHTGWGEGYLSRAISRRPWAASRGPTSSCGPTTTAS